MNPYHQEQREALAAVRAHLLEMAGDRADGLRREVAEYVAFRGEVDAFLARYFGEACSDKCYRSRLSACCSREGIITFFADVVINALFSSAADLDLLAGVLERENAGFKCVYLGAEGCRWRIKPIVCQMFLCDPVKERVFRESPEAGEIWEAFKIREKRFTWPDRPVLFDGLEARWIEAGYDSSLMYMHNSPGLLRLKGQFRRGGRPGLRTGPKTKPQNRRI